MKLTPLRILGLGYAVFLLYSFPGYLDTATADMLLDARASAYGDWGSPILARIWWLLGFVVGGPPGMLLLQSLLALGGAHVLLRRALDERTAALCACGVLLFPPVLGVQAVICTASVFAGFALAGTALVTSPCPRRKLGGLVLLMAACDFHPSAPFAVFPLVVLGLEWRPKLPRLKRYAIAVAAFAVILATSIALERSIVELRSYRKEAALARHDIRGIARQLGTTADARLALPDGEPQVLLDARREMIADHPGAYLAHRLHHLAQLLISKSKLQTAFTEHGEDHARSIGYRARHSAVQHALNVGVRAFCKTPLAWAAIYFAGGLVVLGIAIVRRQRLATMLVASGLAWELAAAFFTTSADRKHSHWLIVTALLGAILVVLRHREDRAHRALEIDADRPAVPVE